MPLKILGVKIDKISKTQAVKKVDGFISSSRPHQIVTVNPEFIIEAQKNQKFRHILNKADLSLADGTGILWVAKYLKNPLPEKIPGADLIWELIKLAEKKGYSIYLLGSETKVVQSTVNKIKKKYSKIKIAGVWQGLKKDEWSSPNIIKMIQKVAKTSPDILFVAFGAPKQEIFIAESLKNLNCRVAIGVGGTFDYISGKIKRAPNWMQSLGLEWLYRLIRQPSRIGRIYNAVIKFPLLVLISKK